MNRLPQLLIVSLFLGLPGFGWACGACLDSHITYFLSTYWWMLLVLVAWGICHTIFGERWDPDPRLNRRAIYKRFATGALVFIVLAMVTMGATVLIGVILLSMFLGVGFRMLFRKAFPFPGKVLTLMTAVLLAVLVGVGVAQRLSRDSFDHARATIIAGTTTIRTFSNQFARDPDFDPERLRPMIREGERNDREWAFMILTGRKNREDLDLFLPEIAALPEIYFEANNYWDSNAMYFQYWIGALGVSLDEVTRQVDEIRQIVPPNP